MASNHIVKDLCNTDTHISFYALRVADLGKDLLAANPKHQDAINEMLDATNKVLASLIDCHNVIWSIYQSLEITNEKGD